MSPLSALGCNCMRTPRVLAQPATEPGSPIIDQTQPGAGRWIWPRQKQLEVRLGAQTWGAHSKLNDRGHLPSPIETE